MPENLTSLELTALFEVLSSSITFKDTYLILQAYLDIIGDFSIYSEIDYD